MKKQELLSLTKEQIEVLSYEAIPKEVIIWDKSKGYFDDINNEPRENWIEGFNAAIKLLQQ